MMFQPMMFQPLERTPPHLSAQKMQTGRAERARSPNMRRTPKQVFQRGREPMNINDDHLQRGTERMNINGEHLQSHTERMNTNREQPQPRRAVFTDTDSTRGLLTTANQHVAAGRTACFCMKEQQRHAHTRVSTPTIAYPRRPCVTAPKCQTNAHTHWRGPMRMHTQHKNARKSCTILPLSR